MGWKEIAGLLRVSERTIKENWERWRLPIKLLPTKRGYRKPVMRLADFEEWLRTP